MPGKKPISKTVEKGAAFQEKLQKPAGSPMKLTNEEQQKYTVKCPFAEEFSIPSNIIYYVARNPKFPKKHLKFISTCKSLVRMSRIISVKTLVHNFDDDCNEWMADHKQIKLENQFFKLWIHNRLTIGTKNLTNLASTLVNHVYKFSLRGLGVQNQVLTFEELQFLVSGDKLEEVEFYYNVVKNAAGCITQFEKVFELLCCKSLKIRFPDVYHGVVKNTACKIIETLSSKHIPVEQWIRLWEIPEEFNFDSFSEFLKVNMHQKQHSLSLSFVREISDAYKNQIQLFINEIIQIRGVYAHTVPMIEFHDQNREAYLKLRRMRLATIDGILQKSN